MDITLLQLDAFRAKGMRPQALCCIVKHKRVLFVYEREYDLWQFPQGGVDNGESVQQAAMREMNEELGEEFAASLIYKDIIAENTIKFLKEKHGARPLHTDAGKAIIMKGKHYFFTVLETDTRVAASDTQFAKATWLTYEDAVKRATTLYQKGKKRVTLAALEALKEHKYI
ncbi:MAG: NUDIX domain-containing protein [Candidatus Magasanikbacteria bacterium]|jgi:putative (di)nucleoside polyphosphate hydrolase|nr:NUDIX domain-containing protein [Candidatus Magasanikbacteria bacterium]